MHRPPPSLAAILAVLLLLGPPTVSTSADTEETLGQARAFLDRGEARAAVTFLEEALADAPPDRHAPLLDLLRRAYSAAAKEAEARGRKGDAELYRDNLQILDHKHPAPPQPAPKPELARPPDTPSTPPAAPVPKVAESVPIGRLEPPVVTPDPQPKPEPPCAPLLSLPSPGPVAPNPAAAADEVQTADVAFRASRYEEAGRIYGALDRQGRLPPARRDHWAYCRWTEVVRRINAKPRTPEEWAEIDAEIQRIRALSPNNWYGEYLRNRASERSVSRRLGKSNRLVVRGSAPEEPLPNVSPSKVQAKPKPKPKTKPAPAPTPAPTPAPATAPAPRPNGEAVRPPQPARAVGAQWQVRETANFRILHENPDLAEQAAEVAEAARESQVRRWVGSGPKGPWSPKCDLYLYPTARVFAQMTNQPEQSPGFSTMGMNGGRIIARRINLRADHPNLLKAVLPHEITHVVLADLFPHQQIPRWADEGMAVLSEPASEQQSRTADLDDPLASGQLFKLEQLMTMDYPDGKFWGLYYAQSVSLTRYLVERGNPTKFIEFVQRAQTNGVESELKRIYKIDGFTDLHNRWTTYARAKSSETTASSANSEKASASALK